MVRKIDIRARVFFLDKMLQQHKHTAAAQADERAQLVEQCRLAGDHVPEYVPVSHNEYGYACGFCGLQFGISREQQRRNLVTTR